MFYRAIGYAVWKLAMAQLRSRYGHLAKPGGAAVATAVALIAVYVATRGDDE
jgi:2-methylcitrate dehydratase PrpD